MAKKIGRYEIIREIGRGGTAAVYLAYDSNFEREVAVKVMHRVALNDPGLFKRFQREARTIAALEHPAVVPIYDFGEEEGRPFLVMRYLSGGSLVERIRRGPLPIEETARVLLRIGGALDAAHAGGIVHRDLKPSNILFDQAGEAFLTDFGIALISETTSSLTGSAVLGTPAYMSPEQIRGEGKVDGRSDIYALGIVLFEMLTGKPPFTGDTPAQVMMMHLANPTPRLPAEWKDVPESINNILVRALAKEPEFRFQNASEMGGVFSAITASHAPGAVKITQTDLMLQETSITRVDLESDRKTRYGALLEKQAALSSQPKPVQIRRDWMKWGGAILGVASIAGAIAFLGGFFQPPIPIPSPTPTRTATDAPTAAILLKKNAPAEGMFVTTEPTVSWNALSGAINYEYCIDTNDNDACDGFWISTESEPTAALSGLASNATYYWQVRIQFNNDFLYADGGAWWSFIARSQTFADVPIDHPNWEYIEALYLSKVSAGCSTDPVSFCPDVPMTRAMMSIFMGRFYHGVDYQPPAATGMVFADVLKATWAADWIEQMYADKLTTGCGINPLKFCPNNYVTRAAFAVYILRTMYKPTYVPPRASHLFSDVPVKGKEWMEDWIEQFYREVNEAACGTDPLRYCPEDPITRADASKLLVLAFDLALP